MSSVKERLISIIENYLLGLARLVLRQYKPVIIGITGSVGKTTTKELLASVMKANGRHFRKTEGNLNADLGIALTILGYDESPAFWEWPLVLLWLHLNYGFLRLGLRRFPPDFIVEMGIDRLGDMARMLQTIKPTIGIVTWIGEGHHLQYLKDAATIAREKGLILAQLPKDGLAIIPAHDPQAAVLAKLSSAPVVKVEAVGLEAAAATARAVAKYLRLDSQKTETAIANFALPKGRLNFLPGIRGSRLLDDSYNSSLPSVKLALATLEAEPGQRKIAILGDILEQGTAEKSVHESVAIRTKKVADLFIGVGSRMRAVDPDQWFATPDEAAAALPSQVRSGDLILVKGSQGMRMEKISFVLSESREVARAKLPRQNRRWQQIPFRQP